MSTLRIATAGAGLIGHHRAHSPIMANARAVVDRGEIVAVQAFASNAGSEFLGGPATMRRKHSHRASTGRPA